MQPIARLRADAQVDGATGHLVGRVAFADRHWIDRIIGYGIAVHEGALFGIANQILGTVTALFLIVLAVSGAILWWRRRPVGLLGAPLPVGRPRFGAALAAAIIALGLYMPLFGVTLMIVLLVERAMLRRISATRAMARVRVWHHPHCLMEFGRVPAPGMSIRRRPSCVIVPSRGSRRATRPAWLGGDTNGI